MSLFVGLFVFVFVCSFAVFFCDIIIIYGVNDNTPFADFPIIYILSITQSVTVKIRLNIAKRRISRRSHTVVSSYITPRPPKTNECK